MNRYPRLLASLSALLMFGLAACGEKEPAAWQGYLEGEFVYVASPIGGQLESLAVAKGAVVVPGTPLFALERASELASQKQAAEQLRGAKDRLEDLRKGARPSEIAAKQAQLEQARAAAELSRLEWVRQESLLKQAVISQSDYDRARLTHEAADQAVDDSAAQLETSLLGGRADALAAAETEVQAAAAAKARADWAVDQKVRSAPAGGLVFDTLYREGEYVSEGSPVVVLLPPANLKVRFFVSEKDFGRISPGQSVRVSLGRGAASYPARVSYLSPQPEYTPPVLYNRDNRDKLVYMVEAVFESAAPNLHPGQPVDVDADTR